MTDRQLRVLVVDDQPGITSIMTLMLCRRGYEAVATNDSRQALRVACEFKPDVILLDIQMPYMNGYEVARRVRREPGFERVPIIAVTSLAHGHHLKRSAEAGIDRQLVKPCDIAQLETLIAEVTA